MVSSTINVVSGCFSETQGRSQEKDFLLKGGNLEQDQAHTGRGPGGGERGIQKGGGCIEIDTKKERVEERCKASQERVANAITDLKDEGREKKTAFLWHHHIVS